MWNSVVCVLILCGFAGWVGYRIWDDIMWIIDNWDPPKKDDEK